MPWNPTFGHLVDRFGEVLAWQYLHEIEKASHIRHPEFIDPETRLANAIRKQDVLNKLSLPMAA